MRLALPALLVATLVLSLTLEHRLSAEAEDAPVQGVQPASELPVPRPPGGASFNEHGQLSRYPGKVTTARPRITKRTIVAFAIGQSNAANHADQQFAAPNRPVFNFFEGQFYEAADPLLGAGGYGGSVWTNLATKLVDAGIADKVILLSAAVGGTSIKDWRDKGPLNAMFRQRLEEARKSGLAVTHFFWHQGESDQGMPPAEYSDGLLQVIRLARSHFPNAKFFVAQASRCGLAPSSPALLEAQRKVTRRRGVYLGPNSDVIDTSERYDKCHFSGRAVERHADDWLEAIRSPKKEGRPR